MKDKMVRVAADLLVVDMFVDNGINPKGKLAKFSSKMTSSEVRTKLTKLGFYKNNFAVLIQQLHQKLQRKMKKIKRKY